MSLYPDAFQIHPMLIWKLPDNKKDQLSNLCSSGEYFLEEKIDGALYMFERTENNSYLFSRGESKVTGELSEKGDRMPHIISALSILPPHTVIIGEVYYPGGTSKDVTTITGALPALAIKRQEDNPIHYYLHDIIFYDNVNLMGTGAEDRYNILEAVWNKHNLGQYDFLRLAVKVDADLEAEISRILRSGGEGAVLKKRNYPYVPGKRPAWSTVKIKQMDSIDLVCTGFCSPTKEYTGKELDTWPYWSYTDVDNNEVILYSKPEEVNPPVMNDGETYGDFIKRTEGIISTYRGYPIIPVTKPYALGWKTAIEIGAYDENNQLVKLGTVSSGLTDELRADFTCNPQDYLGKVCSLDCMSINKKDHTLRHPVFKMWREDKNAKDCTISEVFA